MKRVRSTAFGTMIISLAVLAAVLPSCSSATTTADGGDPGDAAGKDSGKADSGTQDSGKADSGAQDSGAQDSGSVKDASDAG